MTEARKAKLVEDNWLVVNRMPGRARRAVPYQIARSSLFAGLRANLKTRKDYSHGEELKTYSAFKITQTGGEQLVQRDGTVWLELLHLALKQEDDDSTNQIPITVTENGLLRILGQVENSENRRNLRKILKRLCTASVTVEQGETTSWSGWLLVVNGPEYPRARGGTFYIDRNLAKCFKGGYTLLNREQRYQLENNPLAQWLHAFYATHRSPRPLNGSLLQRISGCQVHSDEEWHDKLWLALKTLSTVTGWKCTYNFDYDNVQVERGLKENKSEAKTTRKTTPPTPDENDI